MIAVRCADSHVVRGSLRTRCQLSEALRSGILESNSQTIPSTPNSVDRWPRPSQKPRFLRFIHFINSSASRYLRARTEIEVARDIHRVLLSPIDRRIGDAEFYG